MGIEMASGLGGQPNFWYKVKFMFLKYFFRSFMVIFLLLAFLFSGCGTNYLLAPPGREVYMLTQDDPVTVRAERKVWYWGWGYKSFNDATSIPAIEEHDLKKSHQKHVS